MKNRIAALVEGGIGGPDPAPASTPAGPLEVRVHRCVLEAIIQHNMRDDLRRAAEAGDQEGFESVRQRLRRSERFMAWLDNLPAGTVEVTFRPAAGSC